MTTSIRLRRLAWPLIGSLVATLCTVLPAAPAAAAVNLTVDSTDDATDANPGDGVCDSGAGACTLRAAVREANESGGGTINLPAGTYVLSVAGAEGGDFGDSGETGDLDLKPAITINGDGAATTVIDAGGIDRVFDINFSSFSTHTINDVTIQGGSAVQGSGIRVLQRLAGLNLNRVVVRSNGADGIYTNGEITVTDTEVRDNTGNGIVVNNDSNGSDPGELDLVRSTVAGNGADGVRFQTVTRGDVVNSTISGNVRSGLFVQGTVVNVNSSTIANDGHDGIEVLRWFSGGFPVDPDVNIRNSIVADNTRANCTTSSQDGSAVAVDSLGWNLQNTTHCAFDQGTDHNSSLPGLGALLDNGGHTRTHAIDDTSPAYDAGDSLQASDQRGTARPQGAADDIGAYEFTPPPVFTIAGPAEPIDEGGIDPVASFEVTLSPAQESTHEVTFSTDDGTATGGVDYDAGAGAVLTFTPGQTSKVVDVDVFDDAEVEGDETLDGVLSAPTGGAVIAPPGRATATIADDDLPLISIADGATDEDAGPLVLEVSLDQTSPLAVTADVVLTGSTATAGDDFDDATIPITIPAGSLSADAEVPLVDDDLDEDAEVFHAELANVVNAIVDDGAAEGTITDDDPLPSLSIEDESITEGDVGDPVVALTVTLAPASGRTVTATLATADATASDGDDYVGFSGEILEFAPGTTSRTIGVQVLSDLLDEDDETLTVDITGTVNATTADASGLVTIEDDDPKVVTITDAEASEDAEAVSFTLTLDPAADRAASVQVSTEDGSATAGDDYTPLTNEVVDFPAGTTEAIVEVPLLDDDESEPTETFTIAIVALDDGLVAAGDGSATGTITDDDLPDIAISDAEAIEGSPAGPAVEGALVFEVTLSAPHDDEVSVDFATIPGTATGGGVDFTDTSGTLTFDPGVTSRTIEVPTTPDVLDEFDETLTVVLSDPLNGTLVDAEATGLILDDDDAPTATVSADPDVVPEGDVVDPTVTVRVELSGPSGKPIGIEVGTLDGTAIAGSDYTALTEMLAFAPGETSKDLEVSILADTEDEDDETFTVTLDDPSNVTIAPPGSVTVTIVDDDPHVLSIDDVSRLEGTGGATTFRFTVSLAPVSDQEVRVDVATSDGTAVAGSDYTARNATLVFAPGTAAMTFDVPVAADAAVEPDETFTVTLADAVNAVVGDGEGVGTIRNDDQPPPSDTVPIEDADADGEAEATVNTDEGDVTVTLTGVEEPGSLTVRLLDEAPADGGTAFRLLDVFFDITVDDAVFSAAEVCLPFDPQALPAGVGADDLRLLHIVDGEPIDITSRVDADEGVVCGVTDSFSPFAIGYDPAPRHWGDDRIATAAATSAALFVDGAEVVYVATARDFADALVAGPAAAMDDAPVLLVEPSQLPEVTATELRRLDPDRIVVVGGPEAVEPRVVDDLDAIAPTSRLQGSDRYATSVAVAGRFDPGVPVLFVATGEAFPDGLGAGASAAAGGGPVLLVRGTAMPPEVAAEIRRLAPERIIVAGGPDAVSDTIVVGLAQLTEGSVARAAGATRYETSTALSRIFADPGGPVFVATGEAFPDSLSASAAAARLGGSILLVRFDHIPDAVRRELARLEPTRVIVIGGPNAVAPTVRDELAALVPR